MFQKYIVDVYNHVKHGLICKNQKEQGKKMLIEYKTIITEVGQINSVARDNRFSYKFDS